LDHAGQDEAQLPADGIGAHGGDFALIAPGLDRAPSEQRPGADRGDPDVRDSELTDPKRSGLSVGERASDVTRGTNFS
jgi:hypothetical protein